MQTGVQHTGNQFLLGGGEMGRLTRAYDWSKTSIGDIDGWPQSLRTTLSIILHSKFPMFLFWGPEQICFYNDAYRPSLGNDGKHPSILGMPGEEAWPEIWHIIKPLIDQVLAGGEATWSEDQLIPIYRNGKIEDVYWTFSYSPVNDESGEPAGVFVTCTETTKKVLAFKNESLFRNVVAEAPMSTALLTGPDFVVEIINGEGLKVLGKNKSIIGKPLLDGIPEMEGQSIIRELKDVYATGKTYRGHETLVYVEVDGKLKPVYVNFIYKPLLDNNGKPWGVLVMSHDVSEQVTAHKAIAESDERARLAVEAAMMGTFDMDMQTREVITSPRLKEIFGFTHDTILHYNFLDCIHPQDKHIRNAAYQKAFQTGTIRYEVRIVLPEGIIRWISVHGQMFLNEKKEPTNIRGTVLDITEQKNFVTAIEESEKRFRNTVMQVPIGITIFKGRDFMVEMANETYLQIVDRRKEDFVGRTLFESLPEVREVVEPLLTRVMETGEPYYGTEFQVPLNRFNKTEITYFNFVYQPLRETDGSITGIIVVANEVTHQVAARHALAQSEKQFRKVVMQSPIAMTILRGSDWIIELANDTLLKNIWRREEHEVIGKKLLDVFPELTTQEFPALLRQVAETGKIYRENEAPAYVNSGGSIKKFYLDFEYAPLFDTENNVSAIMVTVNDVTEKVEARQYIKEAADRLTLATEGGSLATWDLDLKTYEVIYTPRQAEIFGHDKTKLLTHAEMRKQFHPEDLPLVHEAFNEALQTGVYHYEARIIHPNDSIHWIKTQGKVLFDDNHQPVRMLGIVLDITEQKRTGQIIEESEKKFRLLANSMPQLVWTSDATGNVNYYNQSVFDFTGLASHQVYEGGWMQIVHPDDREQNMQKWMEAIQTGRRFLFEHRFLRYDGEYRWQLSRAIPQRDSQGNIQMWVGTSTDIHDRKLFTDELEKQVEERTKELKQINEELVKSNSELAQFAYVASHDLQEPLRKIQTFASRIADAENNLSEKGKDYFQRMQMASKRMQQLIVDLLSYSSANTSSEKHVEYADLNILLRTVKDNLRESIEQKHAVIESSVLPSLNVIIFQFGQLFTNLISNALKFSAPGVAPHIIIHADIIHRKELNITGINAMNRYHRISFRDNGIGFDKGYSERIFQVFQRLHSKDAYEGTGIGLAICKKIVENHHGIITASSELGKGALFTIYVPA